MEQVKVMRGFLRGLKLLLFFAALILCAVASLVLLIRSDKTEFSARALLTGAYFTPQTQSSDFLQRDLTHDAQTAPTITLSGGDTINVEIGGSYSEPGFSAQSADGADLSNFVSAEIVEDKLVYTVSDALGNETSVSRDITYVDTTPPDIILTDGAEVHIPVGTEYTEPGFSAIDNADGDVTAAVTVSGEVEKYKIGQYPITYTVSDALGNTNTVTRMVYRDAAEQPEVVDPDGKVIYLTFDDGPWMYTEKLLDILDQYGVKVTFFVTAQFEDYLDMIGEEFRRGHTVAIHSYSHDFEIYSSEDDFFADINKMQEVIKEQTGQETTMLRFIGGSSNTISEAYSYGIMSRLAEDLEAMGFQYYDWNTSSGDAGETTSTDQVVYNVTSEIPYNGDEPSIVLQHDIKDFSIDAVPQIIEWGLENGYTFLPLTPNSPTAHHGINN